MGLWYPLLGRPGAYWAHLCPLRATCLKRPGGFRSVARQSQELLQAKPWGGKGKTQHRGLLAALRWLRPCPLRYTPTIWLDCYKKYYVLCCCQWRWRTFLGPHEQNVADSCFHNIGRLPDKMAAVLFLKVKHLLVHLLHGHVVSENDGHSQIATTAEVTGDIICLVSTIGWVSSNIVRAGYCWLPWLLSRAKQAWRSARRERGPCSCWLKQVSIELFKEGQAGNAPTYGGQCQMVQVTVGGPGQLYGSESDVMEIIIINAISLICVFYWLVDWVCGGVGFHSPVQHLKQGCPVKNIHVPICVVLDLAGEENTIPDPSSPSTAGSELSGSRTGSESSQPPSLGHFNNAKLL